MNVDNSINFTVISSIYLPDERSRLQFCQTGISLSFELWKTALQRSIKKQLKRSRTTLYKMIHGVYTPKITTISCVIW